MERFEERAVWAESQMKSYIGNESILLEHSNGSILTRMSACLGWPSAMFNAQRLDHEAPVACAYNVGVKVCYFPIWYFNCQPRLGIFICARIRRLFTYCGAHSEARILSRLTNDIWWLVQKRGNLELSFI